MHERAREPVIRLRLLADDLTGALDTAAQFVSRTGPVPVFWTRPGGGEMPPSAAFDSFTRDGGPAEAVSAVSGLADVLEWAPGVIAFKKVDSLLRGHSGLELATCLGRLAVRHCIVAPASPLQGRVTSGGLQYARTAEGWLRVGEDLGATLEAQGWPAVLARPGDPVPEGLSLWDAETDEDLRQIAAAGLSLGEPVLWCGSSGLAGRLAGSPPRASGGLARPVLGLFGSDHPATTAQLRDADPHRLRLRDGGDDSAAALTRRLGQTGVALAQFDLPPGLSREEAAGWIARETAALLHRIAAPRTLLVAGGATLRALCVALGAWHLDVLGQIMPGVPRAVLRGGSWDGIEIVSQSGAFGEAGLLRRLVSLQPEELRA